MKFTQFRYYDLFDTARAQLGVAYTEQSCYSMSIPTFQLAAERDRPQKLSGAYFYLSRNIARVKELGT